MTQQINPEAIMQRLRELLDELETVGWRVGLRATFRPDDGGGRVTLEVGENGEDSNADH